jgi:hypothetical protein
MAAVKVLAGPILRLVTETSVSVWIAVDRAFVQPIALRLYAETQTGLVPVAGQSTELSVHLGNEIRIHLLRVTDIHPPLNADTIYQYEISCEDQVLTDDPALWLADRKRPSFSLPAKIAGDVGLQIAHASCRKHYGGGPDALPVIASILDQKSGLSSRIRQLFLTGDQIYADDLPEALLKHIHKVIDSRFGWKEELGTLAEFEDLGRRNPGSDTDFIHRVPQDAASKGALDRVSFLIKIGFKYDTGVLKERDYFRHHLLSFQEWCVMYLLCWSEVLWEGADLDPKRPEQQELVEFRSTLPHVRKVFANVPTYMIFDDHDITDDWFQESHRALLEAQLTANPPNKIPLRIVRNGLLAYAIFQDWGNQPDDYEEPNLGDKIFYAVRYAGDAAAPDAFLPANQDAFHALLGITGNNHTVPNLFPGRKRWHYSYTWADYHVVVLDSRTWRGLWNKQESLVTEAALSAQLASVQSADVRYHILVSPCPIAGFYTTDYGQNVLLEYDYLESDPRSEPPDVVWDDEAWRNNAAPIEFIVQAYRKVDAKPIVLSGDVHYAYSEWAQLSGGRLLWDDTLPRDFLQLCSSSAKNTEELTRMLSLVDLYTAHSRNMSKVNDSVMLEWCKENLKKRGLKWLNALAKDLAQLIFYPEAALTERIKDVPKEFLQTQERRSRFLEIIAEEPFGIAMPALLSDRKVAPTWGTPLATSALEDGRGGRRYVTGQEDPGLAEWLFIPAGETAKAWHDSYAVNGQAFLDLYGFLSVGNANVGFIGIRKLPTGACEVVHAIAWTLTTLPGYQNQPSPGADGVPAWAVTRHRTEIP